MIPVLYSQDERDYGHNGIGVLSDVIYYTVTEEANGEFELYLEYPVNGRLFHELQYQRLIKAKPNDLDADHVFRIYEIVKDLESHMVYIYATSKTNDLGTNLVKTLDVQNKTAQEALNLLKSSLVEPTEFNFVSDITTRSSTYWEFRNPLNCIVGEDNSLVKYWGGEVKRTNDTIYLYSRRGRDNVTVLREGKNIKGLEFTVSTKGLVTKIVPYFIRYDENTGEEIVTIGNTVSSPLVNNYPIVNIMPVDYTLWDELETAADLNAAASGYFTYQNPGVDKPKVSLDIDIMQLSESSQYKQYSNLESLIVFDSVNVYLPKFDVNVEVRVNKIVYNGLLERADTINCGDPIGSLFDDVRRDYTELIGGTESKLLNIVQRAGEGSSTIFRGPDEPVKGMKPGDLWYKPIGGSDKEMYQWTGAYWELILSTKDINTNKELVDDAIAMAEQAKQEAEQSYLDSVAEAERLVTAQTEAFDAEMAVRQGEIADAKEQADLAISKAEANAVAIFGKLDLATYEANKTAVETELGKKLATATYNAQTQTQDALIASKVAIDTYNTKVTELNSLIAAAQTKADTATTDLLKKADTTFVNTELAKKLATSTYNTKMTSLDTAISGHNTRIKATEDGLVLTATKVEVDAIRTRMSEAETEISQNSDAIALKASQSSLDTTNGKLATAEASLVVQAGQIASKVSQTDFNALNGRVSTAETTITQQAGQIALKASQLDLDAATDDISDMQSSLTIQAGQIAAKVSQTDFNALNGRVGTAESSITQQASQIASKVSQTDFNALNGRVGTAESSISQQAGEIALRVTTATYNAGIGSKENTITKATTAPAHLNGRLWLDTSATPNVLKRSTGTAWVKVTPTTPGEVGAYSAGDGSALAGRVSTAETSITANTTAINLRATKTDLDAAKGRLTTAEGTITVQAGQIALKANQTTVDTLTGRVGTAETNISANTTAINLRATKTSVDTLTGRVTTAEGNITTQAGQIALRATTATVNALTGRVSAAESSLSVQAGKIDLAATKTELTTAIDGIEIGGRNLVKGNNGGLDKMYLYLSAGSATLIDESLSPTGKAKKLTITSTASSRDIMYWTLQPLVGDTLMAGEVYTISFVAKASSNVVLESGSINQMSMVGGAFSETITTEYRKYSVRVMPQVDSSIAGNYNMHFKYPTAIPVGQELYIQYIKIEKGNKATDWTPAPEDVDAAISTVQANLTVEAGKITALTTRVGTSESNITNVTQTVSGINTTISTLRTDVNGKATIVSLNEVKSTADGNKTTISNHSGRLTTVETTVSGLQTTVSNKADKSQITQLTTSISTKVESATYNTKMTQLDTAINLRVVQGDVTAAILADKKIKDTRTTNQLPSWYYTNYSSQRVEEFKTRTTIGVPGVSTYVKLVTDVPWSSTSGGVVVQTAYSSDGIYTRSGNSAGTAWGTWVKQTDSANVLAQVNLSTEGVLIQGKRIQLDGDVTMTAAYVTKLNAQTLTAITANITSIRSQVLVTDSVTSTHVKADTAMIDNIFGTTALITQLTSKTAFISNIQAINISADKITTGTLNASNVNIINLNVSKLVGDTSNFVKSAWNGLNSSLSIDSTGLKSYTSNLEIRLTAGYTRYYISNAEVGYMAPLVSTSDTTIKAMGIVAPSGGQIVLGRQVTNGVFESISVNGTTGDIGIKRPLDFSLGGVDIGKIYGHATNGLIISSAGAEIQFFQGGTSLMYGVAGGLRMYRQINMNQNSIDNVTSLVANEVATPTLRKVATLATDNLLKFTRAGVTYSEILAGGFRMHIQINMNTNNIAGVGTLTYASDARYKSSIVTRDVSDLDIIRNIRYVDYTFDRNGSRQRGLIAQELMNADSKLVTTSEDGYLSYDSQQYTHTIGHGLQELDGNVRDLRDGVLRTNKDLLSKIEELQNKIQQLEEKLA